MTDPARSVESDPAHEEPADLSEGLVSILEPMGVAAEAYRTLRTNLLYAFVDDSPRTIVFTSPAPKEGKSTSCANLGVTLAQADKSTLIIDCDLRRPNVHHIFGLRNFRGLVDVIVGKDVLQEVSKEPLPKLKVLTSGHLPPNPAELLGSRRFAELLSKASEEFEYVLLDAPPVGMVSDPIILATQADGVLLVVNAQNTKKGALQQSLRSLKAVDANILGTVLNSIEASRGSYHGYGSYTYG